MELRTSLITNNQDVMKKIFNVIQSESGSVYAIWSDVHAVSVRVGITRAETKTKAVVNVIVHLVGKMTTDGSDCTNEAKYIFLVDVADNSVLFITRTPIDDGMNLFGHIDVIADYLNDSPYSGDVDYRQELYGAKTTFTGVDEPKESEASPKELAETDERFDPFNNCPEIDLKLAANMVAEYIHDVEKDYFNRGIDNAVVTAFRGYRRNTAVVYVLNDRPIAFTNRIEGVYLAVFYGYGIDTFTKKRNNACLDIYRIDGTGATLTYGGDYTGMIVNPHDYYDEDIDVDDSDHRTMVTVDLVMEDLDMKIAPSEPKMSPKITVDWPHAMAALVRCASEYAVLGLDEHNGLYDNGSHRMPFFVNGKFNRDGTFRAYGGIYDNRRGLSASAHFTATANDDSYWQFTFVPYPMSGSDVSALFGKVVGYHDERSAPICEGVGAAYCEQLIEALMPHIKKLPRWQTQTYRFDREAVNVWKITVFGSDTVQSTEDGVVAVPTAQYLVYSVDETEQHQRYRFTVSELACARNRAILMEGAEV